MTPVTAGMSRGGSKRKCAFTIARNFVGVFSPGSREAAGRAGTAITTASSGPIAIVSSPPNFRAPTRSPDISRPCNSWPKFTPAPLSRKSWTAGSTRTALKPSPAETQHPALPVGDVNKRKLRGLRPDQSRLGADRPGISQGMTIAGQQQMVAVIDGEIGRRIEIGAAAPARLLRRLVQMHLV